MNEAKWDAVATAYVQGRLLPANGIAEWGRLATLEALRIDAILPDTIDLLLEVGSGVGRLTPALGVLFPRVVATDTSELMRSVTRVACAHLPNVEVSEPGGITADAAVVWGNLYDEDWTDDEAAGHVCELAACCGYVLVQTTRAFIGGFEGARGDGDWAMIGPMRHWRGDERERQAEPADRQQHGDRDQ